VGIQVKTSSSVVTSRTLAAGAGLLMADGDGVAGNPTITLGAALANLAGQTGTGILAIQSGTYAKVTLQGTSNQITVTDGNGAADPTIALASNPILPGMASVTVPMGTTAQRPSPVNGMLRYNTTLQNFEGYANGVWGSIAVGVGVTSIDVSGGTTGLTFSGGPITSSGVIAMAGTLNTASGGTGLTSWSAGDVPYYAAGTSLSKLAIGASGRYMSSSGTAPQWTAPAALTKIDDTNVTLTLGGSASTALLNAASLTLGWTGQLAVGRGGTGAASFTANGVLYGNTTSAVQVTAAGTTGQVLVGNTGGAPSWSAATSVAVTSLSFGTTGLTPSVATQGAITVAGTLVAANGGTGLSSYAAGDIVYASGTTTLAKLGLGTQGQVLKAGASAPEWGAVSGGAF
jgi:hypothetical protein